MYTPQLDTFSRVANAGSFNERKDSSGKECYAIKGKGAVIDGKKAY